MSEPVTITRTVPGVGSIDFVESDKSRVYWLTPEGGERRRRMPSVTSVIGAVWPKPALLAWYARHGSDAPRMLDLAAERGKAVHTFVEDYLKTGKPTPLGEYPPEVRPYVQHAAAFLWAYDPEPVAMERLVAHPELGYAGRFDLTAYVRGKLTMLDFKTNAAGMVYAEAHIQAHAYALADLRCGADPVERVLLVGVGESGYRPVAGVDCTDAWLRVLDLYKSKRKVENAVARLGREDVDQPEAVLA